MKVIATLFTGLPGYLISEATFFVAHVNLVMAVFNMVPAFPLDGGRLFRSLIWFFSKNMLTATRVAVGFGSFLSFMATQNMGRALVMKNGELVGILSRTDMMRFIKMHMVLGTDH